MTKTLGQERAASALKAVQDTDLGKSKDAAKEFKSFAASIPAMVLGNGLGQTLAFLAGKADKSPKHATVFQAIYVWLVNRKLLEPSSGSRLDVLSRIIKMEPKQYRQAREETLRYLEWYKRFAGVVAAQEEHAHDSRA